jgi:Domain of unknown function (DUF4177)
MKSSRESPEHLMVTEPRTRWQYKFVTSERFKHGVWYAISHNDLPAEPQPMSEVLEQLGNDGWELVAVVPVGETTLNKDTLLKHIFKRPEIQ